jgi:hypothetical protein
MILSSTGLLGAMFYGFIFLFYPMWFLTSPRKTLMTWLLFACYASVLVAAIGNPYLWGGGLGLFIVCILAASMEVGARAQSKG